MMEATGSAARSACASPSEQHTPGAPYTVLADPVRQGEKVSAVPGPTGGQVSSRQPSSLTVMLVEGREGGANVGGEGAEEGGVDVEGREVDGRVLRVLLEVRCCNTHRQEVVVMKR